jgi:hypothetical protein
MAGYPQAPRPKPEKLGSPTRSAGDGRLIANNGPNRAPPAEGSALTHWRVLPSRTGTAAAASAGFVASRNCQKKIRNLGTSDARRASNVPSQRLASRQFPSQRWRRRSSLGLKVDLEAVKDVAAIKAGKVDLNDAANTLLLLRTDVLSCNKPPLAEEASHANERLPHQPRSDR